MSLTRRGSTYAGKVALLIMGIANPVAVLLGPDGAVYIGDWTAGAIYRITGA